jgi:tetratricopeptide (TPR) repeat protein
MDTRKLGKRIRTLRQQRGMSQEDLAEPEYTAAYVSHVEHGKRRASHEALSHFAGRLGITVEQLASGRDPNEDLRLEIEIQRAIAQIHAGNAEEAYDHLRTARDGARRTGHSRAVLRAEEGVALALYRMGDHKQAQVSYEKARDLAQDAEEATTALVGVARCEFQQGHVRDAIHLLESHLIELRSSEAPDPTSLLQTHAALIPVYFESGLLRLAKRAADEGARLAASVADPEQLACLYINRAGLMLTQRKRREAIEALASAEELYGQLGWHSEITKVTITRAIALIEDGELEEAENVLRELLGSLERVSPTDRARVLSQLSQVVRRRGDPKESLNLAREAMRIAGSAIPMEAAEANREAGDALKELGDSEGALKHWRRALKLYRRLGHYKESAQTSRQIGDHLHESGELEAAAKVYREGLAELEEVR